MFRKTLLMIAAIMLCAGSARAQSTEQLAQLNEWNKMIARLREKQAENTRLRQMIEDGTVVMVPLAYQTRDGKLIKMMDFLNDPNLAKDLNAGSRPGLPKGIKDFAPQYIPMKRTELDDALTTMAVRVGLDLFRLETTDDCRRFVKWVKGFTNEVVSGWEGSKKEVLAGLVEQKKTVDADLLRLLKTRDALQAAIKSGKDVLPTVVDAGSFSGEWDTNWGLMKLTQTGNSVTGTYTHQQGRLEGTISNGVLRFRWVQPGNNGKGAGKMEISADGKSFKGAWTYEDDPEKSNNSWNGTRKSPAAGK